MTGWIHIMPDRRNPARRLAALLLALVLAISCPACGFLESRDEPVPTALEIGYRRMFNHDRSENAYTGFTEAVQKAGSVTVARLDQAENTGEGYAIYTFTVLESLFNPDGDTVIHLYEGTRPGMETAGSAMPATSAGSTAAAASTASTATPPTAYRTGMTYLLILSRATDVYYPHPYFHNFNGIFIAADASGAVTQAVSADGADNLLREKETRKVFRTLEEATTYTKSLLELETAWKKGTYRFSGAEILSDDPDAIADGSDYIARVRTGETVFSNRYVQEVTCTIVKPLKGIFGLGSSQDPAENATPPAAAILPGHRTITVLFPAGLDVTPGREWLLFLREEEEYRITAKAGAVPADDGAAYNRFLAAVDRETAVAPTPEIVPATPTPTPRVFTILDAYKDLPRRNPDVRGWVRQEGTVIDYPVLQGRDNDWYLAHNIDKEKVVTGSIVLDFRVDIRNLGRNTPLYGHNMKHGSMFHSLVNYKTEKYFKAHPTLEFDTLYDKMVWEIVAVYVVDSSYNYVITMDFADDTEYRAFLDDITARSLYPIVEPLTLEDKILTMVTCSYEFDGARTVVQARLRQPEAATAAP